MTETISGLHSCKPGNEPVQGETKTFVIEQHPAKNGKKAWTKIKSAGAKFGGEPYRIISAEPTGFTDDYGNISFNLEIEPATLGGGERTTAVSGEAETKSGSFGRSRHDPPPYSNGGLDERQRAIIRQHSQSMALEVLKLKVTLNELTVEDLTPAKLRSLADYFDSDVLGATK